MAKAKKEVAPKVPVKRTNSFVLSKSTKRILGSILSKTERSVFKNMMIGAELNAGSSERMMMQYDILPNGKKAGKAKKD